MSSTIDPSSLIVLALLDGLNVCSLTLLVALISLMFISNASRRTVTLLGATYVTGVFLAYLATGTGVLLLSINVPAVPHLLSRIGTGLMMFIGAAHVLNYFRPGTLPTMVVTNLGRRAIALMRTAAAPPLMFAGILAGFHNFPCACTGGLYMTFLSLIADSPLRYGLLLAYNTIFVLPLMIILFACSSKTTTLTVRRSFQRNSEKTKLVIGMLMLIAGAVIISLIGFELV